MHGNFWFYMYTWKAANMLLARWISGSSQLESWEYQQELIRFLMHESVISMTIVKPRFRTIYHISTWVLRFFIGGVAMQKDNFSEENFWWFFSLERFQSGPWNSYSNSPVAINVLLTSINLRIMIAVSESMGACFLLRGNDPLKTTGEGWLVMLPHQCSLEDILESKIPNLENHPFFWGGASTNKPWGSGIWFFIWGKRSPMTKETRKILGWHLFFGMINHEKLRVCPVAIPGALCLEGGWQAVRGGPLRFTWIKWPNIFRCWWPSSGVWCKPNHLRVPDVDFPGM